MNKIQLKIIYVNNRLKYFKIKDIEHSSTEQAETREILNTMFENFVKIDIVNENIRNIDEVRNETARNTLENSDTKDRILKNIIADNNLTDSTA